MNELEKLLEKGKEESIPSDVYKVTRGMRVVKMEFISVSRYSWNGKKYEIKVGRKTYASIEPSSDVFLSEKEAVSAHIARLEDRNKRLLDELERNKVKIAKLNALAIEINGVKE